MASECGLAWAISQLEQQGYKHTDKCDGDKEFCGMKDPQKMRDALCPMLKGGTYTPGQPRSALRTENAVACDMDTLIPGYEGMSQAQKDAAKRGKYEEWAKIVSMGWACNSGNAEDTPEENWSASYDSAKQELQNRYPDYFAYARAKREAEEDENESARGNTLAENQLFRKLYDKYAKAGGVVPKGLPSRLQRLEDGGWVQLTEHLLSGGQRQLKCDKMAADERGIACRPTRDTEPAEYYKDGQGVMSVQRLVEQYAEALGGSKGKQQALLRGATRLLQLSAFKDTFRSQARVFWKFPGKVVFAPAVYQYIQANAVLRERFGTQKLMLFENLFEADLDMDAYIKKMDGFLQEIKELSTDYGFFDAFEKNRKQLAKGVTDVSGIMQGTEAQAQVPSVDDAQEEDDNDDDDGNTTSSEEDEDEDEDKDDDGDTTGSDDATDLESEEDTDSGSDTGSDTDSDTDSGSDSGSDTGSEDSVEVEMGAFIKDLKVDYAHKMLMRMRQIAGLDHAQLDPDDPKSVAEVYKKRKMEMNALLTPAQGSPSIWQAAEIKPFEVVKALTLLRNIKGDTKSCMSRVSQQGSTPERIYPDKHDAGFFVDSPQAIITCLDYTTRIRQQDWLLLPSTLLACAVCALDDGKQPALYEAQTGKMQFEIHTKTASGSTGPPRTVYIPSGLEPVANHAVFWVLILAEAYAEIQKQQRDSLPGVFKENYKANAKNHFKELAKKGLITEKSANAVLPWLTKLTNGIDGFVMFQGTSGCALFHPP